MKAILGTQSDRYGYTWLCSGMILAASFWFATVGSAAESIWKEKADIKTAPLHSIGQFLGKVLHQILIYLIDAALWML